MAVTVSLIDLTANQIRKLPASLRNKIAAQFGSTEDQTFSGWFIAGNASKEVALLIERAIEMLQPVADRRRARLTDANIEKILEVLLSDSPRAAIDTDLDIDNARLRAEYLQETRYFTAAQVRAASGLAPRNHSEPASRWKREGRLFAVRRAGKDLYPAFQFEDGVPRPVIRKILAALPKDMSGWQIALWFASGNGWLDGNEPQKSLSDPNSVVEAARRLAEPAVG